MSTTKITERNLDEKFLQSLYTTDNPPTTSDVGAVAESDLATAIQSLIDSGVISISAVKSVQKGWIKARTSWKVLISTETDKTTGYNTPASNVRVAYMDVTISEVSDLNKCQIKISVYNDSDFLGELTSKTNLRIYGKTISNSSDTTYSLMPAVTWEVTEFA